MDQDDLAGCLRAWRDRLSPAEIGLAPGRQRRAPGLRREELAQLAGLSVDYLARLEQGRASNPSPSVLGPLARALRLTDQERDHLYRVAGQAPPGEGQINRHITPGVHRILDRLHDVPVIVIDPAATVVARNALAEALLGCEPGPGGPHPRSMPWGLFTGAPTRMVRTPLELRETEERTVADLHIAAGRYPKDVELRALIDDLLEASPRFAELWQARPAERRAAETKTVHHPEAGQITVDCDHLTVTSSHLSLIVYSAAPGSPAADALALVAAIGLQEFSS